MPKDVKSSEHDGASPGKIFIGGLPRDTSQATFLKHFGKYGHIIDHVIMKDRHTHQPRGFGFITYSDPSVVDKVIEDEHKINGKVVEIKRTIPKGAAQAKDFKTKKIFVGGIPTTVEEDELKNFFSKFGKVVEHEIIRDHSTKRSRGFGFIIFDSEQAVDVLLEKGTMIDFAGSQGKKLVFVTNNSTKSRKQYAKKFLALGIDVSEDEIFSSSFAAAMFLKLNNFPHDKKIYVIGEEGILEELKLAGFTGLGGPEDGEKNIVLKSNFEFEYDKSVGAVVVGLDKYINYYKLMYATSCIRENPGCLFIATNRDATGHLTGAQEWPGGGTMVAAVCGSTQKEPVVVGKPSTFMMDFLLERFHISTSKMCMVGDRLDTDILFGNNAGCKTLLVLSGCTSLPTLQDPSNNICPDYYTSSVPDIVELSKM